MTTAPTPDGVRSFGAASPDSAPELFWAGATPSDEDGLTAEDFASAVVNKGISEHDAELQAVFAPLPVPLRYAAGQGLSASARQRPVASTQQPASQQSREKSWDGPFSCASGGGATEELLAFKHLAALEKAVCSGTAFTSGRLPSFPSACMADNSFNAADDAGVSATNRDEPLTARAHLSQLQRAGGAMSTSRPRMLFNEGEWQMQLPRFHGAPPHAGSGPLSFSRFDKSALRGARISGKARGSGATTWWVGTENMRLRKEASKPLGSSAMCAFLQNGGPERMEPLNNPLCGQEFLGRAGSSA
eukprot:gnl/TRDRNA2_/TRDRNA2_42568_c1_seq1.p1 gnl/TRDRNA2_/TRDRNA2_42568_c1~~gnl/TRDRNA2_/TRDRNA2_42568_c1_seq1.p1  ORF type:complete len:303 (-),score=48.45 gnl/TRDRNA2_/TRDRNA2_42568_c1_seq1:183-1091(-)